MISVLLQLLGSAFLSWNAISKSVRMRALEEQFTVPASIGIDEHTAFLKQREYFLNVSGFVILFIGYFLQMFEIDYTFIGKFSHFFVATVVSFLSYILYLLIIILSKLTTKSLVESSKVPEKGKRYLWFS